MRTQLLVIAKWPAPGRVKTRLCPPATPTQAARIAAAALDDTLATVWATPADRRTLVAAGEPHPDHPVPHAARFPVVAQHGEGLAERLAHAFTDTARPDTAAVLVGMDTPQLRVAQLTAASTALHTADAVLGPAADGGWWLLGLRRPADAVALLGVPMSTSDTGAATLAALRRRGLRVALLETLRDVDTAADARAVAPHCGRGRFAAAVDSQLRHVAEVPA
ncbi:TIGR04282 family arsenosugar biosynthesis glycosyltransferase [Actinocatenispora sera]|uniref:Glycosyl transferase n=1 Tax=Actinocatenispora sera TaxID=390989 RepID=A0A810LBS5_9ACTN|nr:TIGR04282 family arsenosugar biosynthesis glycosyltransferase [Actinocatenispora sera]BCJ32335.1 glycosyl transferase [Actinocatenispora sera]